MAKQDQPEDTPEDIVEDGQTSEDQTEDSQQSQTEESNESDNEKVEIPKSASHKHDQMILEIGNSFGKEDDASENSDESEGNENNQSSDSDENSTEDTNENSDDSQEDTENIADPNAIVKLKVNGEEIIKTVQELQNESQVDKAMSQKLAELDSVKNELREIRTQIAQSKPNTEPPVEEKKQPEPLDYKDLQDKISTGSDDEAADALKTIHDRAKQEAKQEILAELAPHIATKKEVNARLESEKEWETAGQQADQAFKNFVADENNSEFVGDDEASKVKGSMLGSALHNNVTQDLKSIGYTDNELAGRSPKELIAIHQRNYNKSEKLRSQLTDINTIFSNSASQTRDQIKGLTGKPAEQETEVKVEDSSEEKKDRKDKIPTSPERKGSPPPKKKPTEETKDKTFEQSNDDAVDMLLRDRKALRSGRKPT